MSQVLRHASDLVIVPVLLGLGGRNPIAPVSLASYFLTSANRRPLLVITKYKIKKPFCA